MRSEIEQNLGPSRVSIPQRVIDAGFVHEVAWAENIQPVSDSWTFFVEYVWVVLNSAMKNQVARGIMERMRPLLATDEPIRSVFGHSGKAAAIEKMRSDRDEVFRKYLAAPDKMAFLESLPWIGGITRYHLAKNYGVDTLKPDRHLVRIAQRFATDPFTLCHRLADEARDRVGTVDLVIWRAANLGWI